MGGYRSVQRQNACPIEQVARCTDLSDLRRASPKLDAAERDGSRGSQIRSDSIYRRRKSLHNTEEDDREGRAEASSESPSNAGDRASRQVSGQGRYESRSAPRGHWKVKNHLPVSKFLAVHALPRAQFHEAGGMIGWMTSTDRQSLRKSDQKTLDKWIQRSLSGTLDP